MAVKLDQVDQNQISSPLVYTTLPPLSGKHAWLVAQAEEDCTGDQIFYNINDPKSYYRCRIPELTGRRIRGCFHGWVILSNHPHNTMWSLWNPETTNTIHLPQLSLKEGSSIEQCCLPFPPHDPHSVLLLTKKQQHSVDLCRLDCKQKRLRWTERTHAEQLNGITGGYGFLRCLTCCNGCVYALATGSLYDLVIQVNIMVKDEEVVINLLPFAKIPFSSHIDGCLCLRPIAKGLAEVLYLRVAFNNAEPNSVSDVFLWKVDMTADTILERMKDLDDDTVFFVDLTHGCSTFYRPAVTSKLGCYIHFLRNMGKVMYSYNIKDKTISLSSTPCLVSTKHHMSVSLWDCRLQTESKIQEVKEDEIMVRSVRDDELVKSIRKSRLLNIPFDVLMLILERCVGVEYLNFRATCKQCQLGAPMIRWRSATSLMRLHNYSAVSPWLMVFDKHRGVVTFTDPMFGEQYFIKTPQEFISYDEICYTAYGWVLIKVCGRYNFFNPFTNDIRNLPNVPDVKDICFSAPPTSPDCMVVGFSKYMVHVVHVRFVNQEPPYWYTYHMGPGPFSRSSFPSPTFYGSDIYILDDRRLNVFRGMQERYCIWEVVNEALQSKSSGQSFLVTCDQHLLVVFVETFGKSVKVFKLSRCRREWEKIDSLGKHMMYVCHTRCFCIEARTPEMENKIYFPQVHSENGKIVFYSLETRKYHTFSGRNVLESFGDFFGTKYHLNRHAWIEPSWS